MKIIESTPGQTVYDLLHSAILYLQNVGEYHCFAVHNDTKIMVYRNSYINDLCDKYDMQRKLDQWENSYRR